jgi:acetylornithine/N-succinyldiaminopimelate aminotransferase
VDGFDHVPFNNMNAVRDAIGPATAGIIVEPIQGEGGVRPASLQFLRDLRAACDEYHLVLGVDEVQTGMGRSGRLFAHEWAGIAPDVMSAAKGIAGGFPLGATLAKEFVAKHLVPGTHGSTFGGNPLACAVARTAMKVLVEERMIENAEAMGDRFLAGLRALNHAVIKNARGRGLLIALELNKDAGGARKLTETLAERGLLAKETHTSTVRFAPPLIITADQVDWALEQIAAGLAIY